MEDRIKTEVQGLYRSKETQALINTDNKSLDAYKRKKNSFALIPELNKKVNSLEERINTLERIVLELSNKWP